MGESADDPFRMHLQPSTSPLLLLDLFLFLVSDSSLYMYYVFYNLYGVFMLFYKFLLSREREQMAISIISVKIFETIRE